MAHFAHIGGNICNSRLLLQSTALHLTHSCFYKCTLTLPCIILSAYWVICSCTAFRCPCLCTVSGWLCLHCLYTVLLRFDVRVLFCCNDWMYWLFVSHFYTCKSKTVLHARQQTTELPCIIKSHIMHGIKLRPL